MAVIGLGQVFLGRGEETEAHIHEALRLSPRDIFAYRWMMFVGLAKMQLGADAEAVAWFRRSIEANRNYPARAFLSRRRLALLGELDRRGPPCRRDLRSIRASPSAATAPTHRATIRLTSPGASAS